MYGIEDYTERLKVGGFDVISLEVEIGNVCDKYAKSRLPLWKI